ADHVSILLSLEIDEVGTCGKRAESQLLEAFHQPGSAGSVVFQSAANVIFISDCGQPCGLSHSGNRKGAADAGNVPQQLRMSAGVTKSYAGQTVSFGKCSQHQQIHPP